MRLGDERDAGHGAALFHATLVAALAELGGAVGRGNSA